MVSWHNYLEKKNYSLSILQIPAPCPFNTIPFLIFDIALIRWILLQSKPTIFIGQNLKAKQTVFAGRREWVTEPDECHVDETPLTFYVRCDPNYNVCLVGMPRGPTVRVMWLADLFSCLTTVSSVRPIYTTYKPHGKSWRLIVFPTL